MLRIQYGDELGLLATVTHPKKGQTRIDPTKPGGIQLVKPDREDEEWARRTLQCPEHCHKWVVFGRIYCPMIGKAINDQRCKRMRKMSLESLRVYLERVETELAETRRQKRQEREARQLEALRLALEGRKAEKGKGKRTPEKGTSGGKGAMTALGTVGPQATNPKESAS